MASYSVRITWPLVPSGTSRGARIRTRASSHGA